MLYEAAIAPSNAMVRRENPSCLRIRTTRLLHSWKALCLNASWLDDEETLSYLTFDDDLDQAAPRVRVTKIFRCISTRLLLPISR